MAADSAPSGNSAWSTIIDTPDADGLRGSWRTLSANGSISGVDFAAKWPPSRHLDVRRHNHHNRPRQRPLQSSWTMGMAPPMLGSISTWSELMVQQVRAIKSIDLIAFASSSLALLNLVADSMTPAGWPIDDVVGRLISGRQCKSTERVVDFPSSPQLPPSQENSRRK